MNPPGIRERRASTPTAFVDALPLLNRITTQAKWTRAVKLGLVFEGRTSSARPWLLRTHVESQSKSSDTVAVARERLLACLRPYITGLEVRLGDVVDRGFSGCNAMWLLALMRASSGGNLDATTGHMFERATCLWLVFHLI